MTKQEQAERAELLQSATAHLTLDELRGGVVSKKRAYDFWLSLDEKIDWSHNPQRKTLGEILAVYEPLLVPEVQK